ncbi:MAG TPA: alpha/beta hydrolase-fold protein [Geobacteraceae bacterium]
MIRAFLIPPLLAVLALLVSSCTPPVTTPIGTVDFRQPGAKRQQTLLVFLPGIHDRAEVFADKGFIAALRASGIMADMIGVDAHLGYYVKREFLPRLKNDVIIPAKKEGYRHIWLVGISLGGFGAIWYDVENPRDLAGIVILSPYLGDEEVVDEVAKAGGLTAWRPPDGSEPDDQHKIWRGLKVYEHAEKNGGRVFLGYGDKDKFATANCMLAAVLPPGQVVTADGGHDWSTWNILWQRMLPGLPMER